MSSSIGTPYHILSECRLKRTKNLSVSDCDRESESTNRLMKRRTWNAHCQASKWVKACRVVCACVAYSHQLTVAIVAPFSGNTPRKIIQSLKHGNQHVRIPVKNTALCLGVNWFSVFKYVNTSLQPLATVPYTIPNSKTTHTPKGFGMAAQPYIVT